MQARDESSYQAARQLLECQLPRRAHIRPTDRAKFLHVADVVASEMLREAAIPSKTFGSFYKIRRSSFEEWYLSRSDGAEW